MNYIFHLIKIRKIIEKKAGEGHGSLVQAKAIMDYVIKTFCKNKRREK
jgi:hypothetical protein